MEDNKCCELEESKDPETKKKLSSRKFLVWVIWMVILVLMVALCVVVSVITKKLDNSFVDFLSSVLNYFFVISIIYLGANVTQKGVYALKDYFCGKHKDDE